MSTDNGRWNRAWQKVKNKASHNFDESKQQKAFEKEEANEAKQRKKQYKQDTKVKGFRAKAKQRWKKRAEKVANSNIANKIKRVIAIIVSFASFVRRHLLLFLFLLLLCLIIIPLALFGVSLLQAIGSSPHYYCDLDASAYTKSSAIYKQYCTTARGGVTFENLNGHYVVQDGSGPCTSCTTLNLLIRYYAAYDINLYDYLWQADGQYTIDGQVGVVDNSHHQVTLRDILNTDEPTTCSTNSTSPYGSRKFAEKHGRGYNYNMSNWGYFSDTSLDIADTDTLSYSHVDISNQDGWVWDLSMDNFGPHSSWRTWWSPSIEIEGVATNFQFSSASTISGKQIKEALDKEYDMSGNQWGVHMWYSYPKEGKNGTHSILITGYPGDKLGHDKWMIIDPALGRGGGFEGPVTSNGNDSVFCWKGAAVEALLNSDSHSIARDGGVYTISTICYILPPTETNNKNPFGGKN